MKCDICQIENNKVEKLKAKWKNKQGETMTFVCRLCDTCQEKELKTDGAILKDIIRARAIEIISKRKNLNIKNEVLI